MSRLSYIAIALISSIFLLSSCFTDRSSLREVRSEPSRSVYDDRINAEGLEGVWEDPETHDLHTIKKLTDGYEVISIIEYGNNGAKVEEMEVKSTLWKDHILSWSYYVPSTGYNVHFSTRLLDGDTLTVEWSNEDGSGGEKSGQETLHRIMSLSSFSPGRDNQSDEFADGNLRPAGKVYKVNDDEVIVASRLAGEIFDVGDILFCLVDGQKVEMTVVSPMQTVSKCLLTADSLKKGLKIHEEMPVYRKDRQ
jgi:hypothetical protein